MAQAEVYKYLEKAKKPITKKEIAKALKIGETSVGCNLLKLFKQNDIKRRRVRLKNKTNWVFEYWI